MATNPAVSLPELPRVRRILEQERLFLVVQDAFLTETARMADVVLPAALWGEKTGQNAEVREGAKIVGNFSRQVVEALKPFLAKYGEQSEKEPRALRQTLFPKARVGAFGLLRDLHGLRVLAADAHVATRVVTDAARELRDDALHEACLLLDGQNQRQEAWVDTMLKESAAQSLVVPS